ncbi:hypothetical protein [Azospirillum isscasi]|uniref:TonB C-terminal domain-containing protein n=1 Tax=Azospirillum isscasi TaxID=3053926 RepID=A0ABU0WRR9_9PROT|nr:hypothetical protein [Azospirillum isscasi]MDQ2105489.1 hypothetical protein [Azospirillum isscasi]
MKKAILALPASMALATSVACAQDTSITMMPSEKSDIERQIASCWSREEMSKLNGRPLPARVIFDEKGQYSGISLVDRSAVFSDPVYRAVGQSLVMTFRNCRHLRAPERLKGQPVEVVVTMSLDSFRSAANTPPAGAEIPPPSQAVKAEAVSQAPPSTSPKQAPAPSSGVDAKPMPPLNAPGAPDSTRRPLAEAPANGPVDDPQQIAQIKRIFEERKTRSPSTLEPSSLRPKPASPSGDPVADCANVHIYKKGNAEITLTISADRSKAVSISITSSDRNFLRPVDGRAAFLWLETPKGPYTRWWFMKGASENSLLFRIDEDNPALEALIDTYAITVGGEGGYTTFQLTPDPRRIPSVQRCTSSAFEDIDRVNQQQKKLADERERNRIFEEKLNKLNAQQLFSEQMSLPKGGLRITAWCRAVSAKLGRHEAFNRQQNETMQRVEDYFTRRTMHLTNGWTCDVCPSMHMQETLGTTFVKKATQEKNTTALGAAADYCLSIASSKIPLDIRQ